MSIGRALMAVHHQLLQTIRDIPLPLPTGRYCLLYYSAGRRKPSFWPTTAQSIKDCSTTNNEKPQWPYFELPASSQELFSYDSPFSSVQFSRSIVSNSLQPCGPQPARLLCPWNSPGKSTEVGCHALLQVIFPIQGSNSGLPHCRQIPYHLNHQGSPFLLFSH